MELLDQADRIKGAPLKDPGIGRPASLAELTSAGYAAFSLAPVYAYTGVDFDLLSAFAAEPRDGVLHEVRGGRFVMKAPVLARCDQPGCVLDYMDLENYAFFKHWMNAHTALYREGRAYYEFRLVTPPVLDPFALEHRRTVPAALDVFTVSGIRARMQPTVTFLKQNELPPLSIDFVRADPEPRVVKIGRFLLEGK